MMPVDQTITVENGGVAAPGDETTTGNCWAACIASILELPIEEVPNFAAYENWWDMTRTWLEERDCGLLPVTPSAIAYLYEGADQHHGPPLCIATGLSPRGDFHHSVLWEGYMVHDPHPSRAGLRGEPLEFAFIYKETYDA